MDRGFLIEYTTINVELEKVTAVGEVEELRVRIINGSLMNVRELSDTPSIVAAAKLDFCGRA